MIILICTIVISLLFLVIAIISATERGYMDLEDFVFHGVFFIILQVFIWFPVGMTMIDSYSSYISMKSTYEEVINQYRNSIDMYEDKAVLTISEETLTDFRYQGYQESISKMISELRNVVASYNRAYVEKNIKKDNIFFGSLIFPPDDSMKKLTINQQGE